jgi:hypothetical protein
VACREASGFAWNEKECMVTAAKDVWGPFLISHPAAKKFNNTPFPEFHKFTVIFGGNSSTGVLRRFSATHTRKLLISQKATYTMTTLGLLKLLARNSLANIVLPMEIGTRPPWSS